jgi:hypothetical protein
MLGSLPESIVMLLYGLFGSLVWIGLFFITLILSIIFHVLNVSQLFRTPYEDNTNVWGTDIDFISIRFWWNLFLFFVLWFAVSLVSTFVMPVFFTFYALIAPLFATYTIKGTNDRQNVLDFIKNTFVYKKLFFFILATISLISNGVTYLGTYSLVGIIIAIIFAYFMGLYNNPLPQDNGFKPVSVFTQENKKNGTDKQIIPEDKFNSIPEQGVKDVPTEHSWASRIKETNANRKQPQPSPQVTGQNEIPIEQQGGVGSKMKSKSKSKTAFTPSKKYNIRFVY